MVRLVGRILNSCQNVLTLKIGIVLQDLLVRCPSTEELQNVSNANPHAPNAGAAAAFPRLNGDSFQKVGLHRIPTLPLKEPPDNPAMPLPKPSLSPGSVRRPSTWARLACNAHQNMPPDNTSRRANPPTNTPPHRHTLRSFTRARYHSVARAQSSTTNPGWHSHTSPPRRFYFRVHREKRLVFHSIDPPRRGVDRGLADSAGFSCCSPVRTLVPTTNGSLCPRQCRILRV